MDSPVAHKFRTRTRCDSGRLSPTFNSRKNSQSTLRSARANQGSLTLRTGEPEPSTSESPSSGGSISGWRREEIRALPQELLSQCLLTMQVRERQVPETRNRPLTTPQQVVRDKVAASQDSTIRDTFGVDTDASCFAEQERVRQMQILVAMWSRGIPG